MSYPLQRKTMQTIERGKVRIIDHFTTDVPDHWRHTGDAVLPSSRGLVMNANSSLCQKALTTFGFFRFQIELNLMEQDEFLICLRTANEVIELRFDAFNKARYRHADGQEIETEVSTTLTVQWILNDERYSLQIIGQGITTLASRVPIASFRAMPFEIELQSTLSKGSAMIRESFYESVNE